MTKNLLLGIDIGTTAAKVLLVSEDGQILARASRGYPLHTPGLGRCEQDAMDWWRALVEIVREVCRVPELAQGVRGIALSTQGGTVVPVDERFQPLARAIVWSDARCAGDRAAFDEALGEGYVYRTCGWGLGRGLPAMQLRRLRLEHPALFARAARFLTVPDFLCAKLTGRPVTDLSNAGINHLTDVRARRYDPRLLAFVGVEEARLSRLAPSCTPVGTLTAEAAAELNLPERVLVSAGAHDQYAVALGAGILEAGDAVIGTGTAWVVTALGDAPDFEAGLSQSVSAVPGKWGSMLSISNGGVCLDWFRTQVAGLEGQQLSYGALDALVAERGEPGAGGLRFYPYFGGSGRPLPGSACRASLLGLDLSHDRGHIARAVMEGVACQTVWALEALEAHLPVRRLYLAGGATKSEVWTQMIAEIAHRPLIVTNVADLACVGAAMMAGVGCGLFGDVAEAARALAPGGRVIEPDPERERAYRKVYDRYLSGAHALRALYGEE